MEKQTVKEIIAKPQYTQGCVDPLDEDRLWTLLMFHKQYDLGDHMLPDWTPVPHYSRFRDWDDMEEWFETHVSGAIITPLYMMDHSGLAFSTGSWWFQQVDPAGWDWGQIGFAITTSEAVKKWFGIKRLTKKQRSRAFEALRAELKRYQEYVNGEVYDIVLEFHTDEGVKTDCVGDFMGWDEVEDFIEWLKKEYKGIPVTLREE